MRENTIIDKLARTLERKEFGKGGIEVLPFVYADKGMQNVIFDNIQPPFAACVPITSGTVSDMRNTYHERITIAVWFGDRMCGVFPDYDAKENERIIDECKQRAYKWLASLNNNSELELVSVNGSDRFYLEGDACMTGYVVNVTLEELQGYGICNL